jgi:hypothetical protein
MKILVKRMPTYEQTWSVNQLDLALSITEQPQSVLDNFTGILVVDYLKME